MNRRDMLSVAPVVAAGLLAPAALAATSDTPILQLMRRHREIVERASAYEPTCPDREVDAEMDRLFWNDADRIEDEMTALPCTCAADFAAKMIVVTCRGGLGVDWDDGEIWQEARALVGWDG